MACDLTQGQGQGQPDNGGQGQPGSGGPEPYSGYGTPQQGPYGAPPPQYGTPPNQQGGYGYTPPQQAPRPIGQAIQELPNQYIKVLTKPSAQSFAEEMGKADWGMVWIQLLIWALVGTILGLIRAAIGLAGSSFVSNNTFNPAAITALTVSGSTFSFIAVPVSLFQFMVI